MIYKDASLYFRGVRVKREYECPTNLTVKRNLVTVKQKQVRIFQQVFQTLNIKLKYVKYTKFKENVLQPATINDFNTKKVSV